MKKQWTKERPVEDGIYFVRWGEESITVVSVYEDTWDESDDMLIITLAEDCHYILGDDMGNKFDDVEWLGPITPQDFLK